MTAQAIYDARALLWTPSDSLKDANRRRIIRAVMVEPGTQVRIARRTHLSQATVSALVAELEAEGVLRTQVGDGERGKRVTLGAVRGVAVGVEVNHNNINVVARRVDSPAMESATADKGVGQLGDHWIQQTAHLIRETVAEAGFGPEHIVSIGLGLPACIDPWTSRIIQVSSSLGWDLTGDLRVQFREQFDRVPVIVDNEVNFAAWGEYIYGAGHGHETMLFVKASSGIGAGLIIDGIIYRGRHGIAGEMGHLTMDPEGLVCRCGNRGCLETLAGGVRMLEQVRQAYSGYRLDQPTSLESLIERAKGGDPVCRRVLQDAGRNIGLALARVCNLMDPEIVVIGGELGRAADLLLGVVDDSMRLHALRGMFDERFQPTKIVTSELGLAAGARGALGFALDIDQTVPGYRGH